MKELARHKPGRWSRCACARCTRSPTADPRWGFDTALVPEVDCYKCGAPIGGSSWRPVTILARFGQMLFEHQVCPPRRRKTPRR